jgi:hypothetical protein
MADADYLYALLEASGACNAYINKVLADDCSFYALSRKRGTAPAPRQTTARSFLEALIQDLKNGVLHSESNVPLSAEELVYSRKILDLL